MRKWLIDRFLPMWAKETTLRQLRAEGSRREALEQENACLRAYIRGMERGLRRARKKEAEK